MNSSDLNKLIRAKEAYKEKKHEYLDVVSKYRALVGNFENLSTKEKESLKSIFETSNRKNDKNIHEFWNEMQSSSHTPCSRKQLRIQYTERITSLKKETKTLQKQYNTALLEYQKRLDEQTFWFIASVRDHDEIIPKIEGMEELEGTIYHDHLSRCWGFLSDLGTAMQYVRDNVTDLNEAGYYDYVVIEPKKQGLCYVEPSCANMWFKAEYKTDKKGNKYCSGYVDCKEPEWAKQTVGWTIS